MATNNNLDDLFEIVSEQEIYAFVKKYAYRHEDFGAVLLKHFEAKLPSKGNKPDKKELEREIDRCFRHVVRISYNRYYDDGFEELDWSKVGKDIARVVKRLQLLLNSGYEEMAAELSVILLERIDQEFEEYLLDDYDFDYDNFHAEELLDIIAQAIDSDRISKESQLEIADSLSGLEEALEFDYVDFGHIVETVRDKLLSDDERIAIRREAFENASEGYKKRKAAEDLWHYLLDLNREDEAIAFYQQNKQIDDLRTCYVKWLSAKGEWRAALKVLDEGLAHQDKLYGHPQWEQYKLDLYEKLNDRPNMIKQARKLFVRNQFSLEYYRKLKKWSEKDQWEEFLRKTIKSTEPSWGHNDNLSQIYVAEGWYEDLFLQMKNARGRVLSPFCKYVRYLDDKQSAILLEAIEKDFKGRFESTRPRKEYYELTSDLLALKESCPLGAETARRIVADCRSLYQKRPAMIDELRRFDK